MKYTELIEMWNKSSEEWKNYEWNAAVIAAKVYSILKKRFELKNENLFRLVNPEEEDNEKIQKTMYSHIGATKLTEKGWAKFGLFLILEHGENTWPKNQYRFISFVKITENEILLKATEDSKEIRLKHEFDEADENLIEKEYNGLLNHHIKDSFKNWLNS